MKILHVCETAIGGVASYLNMMCEIDPADQNIILVPEQHVKGIDTALDIRPYRTTGRNAAAVWTMLRETRRLIREEQPDIVFFQSSFSLLSLAAMRALRIRTPFIYCSHGWSASIFPDGSWKQWAVQRVEGTLCGLADRVINISAADKELAQAAGYRGHHVLIENAVPERLTPTRNDLFAEEAGLLHLLFIGRFDRQKGLDLLLSAFAKAQQARPDLRLHIVGASIRKDGGTIDLPEGAHLAGWVDKAEIDSWYASADVLVVPSRWEGFGMVVPEALRNCTSVLVSNRGALPSLIEEGETGEVFDLTEEAIVACLTKLDKAELQRRRPACRALYERRFTFERLAGEIRALYHEVLRIGAKR